MADEIPNIPRISGEYDIAKLVYELAGPNMDDATLSVYLSEDLVEYLRKFVIKYTQLAINTNDMCSRERYYSQLSNLSPFISKLKTRNFKQNVKKEYKCIASVFKSNSNQS